MSASAAPISTKKESTKKDSGNDDGPDTIQLGNLKIDEGPPLTEREKFLKSVPIFSSVTMVEIKKLDTAFEEQKYTAGQKIITQGELGKGFYVIKTGNARVVRSEDGKDKELDVDGPGDYFGEAALLNNAPRGASVIAMDVCVVWFLDKKHFTTLFADGLLQRVIFAKREAIQADMQEEDEKPFECKQPLQPERTKTDKQKKLIYKAVRENVLFAGMAYKGILKVISKMWRIEVPKGTSVITQGELGDNLYVVEKGKLGVYIKSQDGVTFRKVDKIGKKECFGELALLHNTPRNATIITTATSILWAVDRFTFRRVLKNISTDKLKSYEKFLAAVPLLAPLSSTERSKIAEALDEQTFQAGEVIVKQQREDVQVSTADAMYIVQSGDCTVTRTVGEETYEIKKLKMGDAFGERSLLTSEPRSATVTADTNVELLRLDKHAFFLLLGPLEDILKQRVERYEKRDNVGNHLAEKPELMSVVVTREKEGKEEMSKLTSLQKEMGKSSVNNFALKGKIFLRKDLQVVGGLGKGSFGIVELVKHGPSGETFALKRVKKNILKKKKHQAHILSEKKMLMKLSSPFIISLYATYRDEEYLYFLLECCLGGELYTVLRSSNVFENGYARFYTAGVIIAFNYMHSLNVVYRDLKPENVLLDSMGYPKVADFGFATELDENGRTFTCCGTPAYLSPEIISGKAYGCGVDWWCIGVFIFELLAGYPPFRNNKDQGGNDMMKLCERILAGQYTPPAHFTEEAVDIVDSFLQQKPHRRLGVIKGGIDKIKAHAWFKGFDWEELKNKTLRAPIIPYIEDEADLGNFDYNSKGSGGANFLANVDYHGGKDEWDYGF